MTSSLAERDKFYDEKIGLEFKLQEAKSRIEKLENKLVIASDKDIVTNDKCLLYFNQCNDLQHEIDRLNALVKNMTSSSNRLEIQQMVISHYNSPWNKGTGIGYVPLFPEDETYTDFENRMDDRFVMSPSPSPESEPTIIPQTQSDQDVATSEVSPPETPVSAPSTINNCLVEETHSETSSGLDSNDLPKNLDIVWATSIPTCSPTLIQMEPTFNNSFPGQKSKLKRFSSDSDLSRLQSPDSTEPRPWLNTVRT